MVNYCQRCGNWKDTQTGLCPNCEAAQYRKAKRKIKAKRTRAKVGKVLAGILLGVVGVFISVEAIDKYLVELPLPERNVFDLFDEKGVRVERDIEDTDTRGFSYYQSELEHVAVDEETGMTFIDNELIVRIKSDAFKYKLEEFMDEKDGKIVGEIKALAEYQVQFEDEYTFTDLVTIGKEMEMTCYDFYVTSSPNYVLLNGDEQYIPEDSEWDNEWDKESGLNWGLQAIDAEGAWEYMDEMSAVNVGIIDDMFSMEHEDLIFSEVPLANGDVRNASSFEIEDEDSDDEDDEDDEDSDDEDDEDDEDSDDEDDDDDDDDDKRSRRKKKDKDKDKDKKSNRKKDSDDEDDEKEIERDSHGMQVAGIMAAEFDNNTGISGIVPKCNLYGVAMDGMERKFDTLYEWEIALYYLICEKECNVICCTHGYDQMAFALTNDVEVFKGTFQYMSQTLGDYIGYIVDMGHRSFVICKSAGNQNDASLSAYKYFEAKEDDDYLFQYYRYEDYLKFVNNKMKDNELNARFMDYKEDRDEIEENLIGGDVSLEYDLFAAMENENAKERIIIVGAVENDEGDYEQASFSQQGDRLDIVAPGVDIYSTTWDWKKNVSTYGTITGTSAATPHVAGTAALLYAVDDHLDGAHVKEILIETSTGEYGDDEVGMVNAKKAVEEVLGK